MRTSYKNTYPARLLSIICLILFTDILICLENRTNPNKLIGKQIAQLDLHKSFQHIIFGWVRHSFLVQSHFGCWAYEENANDFPLSCLLLKASILKLPREEASLKFRGTFLKTRNMPWGHFHRSVKCVNLDHWASSILIVGSTAWASGITCC